MKQGKWQFELRSDFQLSLLKVIEDCISFVSLPCVIICQEYLCCSLNPLTSDKSDKHLNSPYNIGINISIWVTAHLPLP